MTDKRKEDQRKASLDLRERKKAVTDGLGLVAERIEAAVDKLEAVVDKKLKELKDSKDHV